MLDLYVELRASDHSAAVSKIVEKTIKTIYPIITRQVQCSFFDMRSKVRGEGSLPKKSILRWYRETS